MLPTRGDPGTEGARHRRLLDAAVRGARAAGLFLVWILNYTLTPTCRRSFERDERAGAGELGLKKALPSPWRSLSPFVPQPLLELRRIDRRQHFHAAAPAPATPCRLCRRDHRPADRPTRARSVTSARSVLRPVASVQVAALPDAVALDGRQPGRQRVGITQHPRRMRAAERPEPVHPVRTRVLHRLHQIAVGRAGAAGAWSGSRARRTPRGTADRCRWRHRQSLRSFPWRWPSRARVAP